MTVSLRPATPGDVDFLHALTTHADVDPFLGARRDRGREAVVAEVERTAREPERFARLVVEVDGEPAGTVRFELENERSSIGTISSVAIDPAFRGAGVALDALRRLQELLLADRGWHRLQLEVYGFNAAGQRLFERAGFVREGVRRRAYRHGEGWTDGVLYGLLADELRDR